MRNSEPVYEDLKLCKICSNPNRSYLELLRYNLYETNRQLVKFCREHPSFGLEDLNDPNASTHFNRHCNEEGFWQEYPELKILKNKELKHLELVEDETDH